MTHGALYIRDRTNWQGKLFPLLKTQLFLVLCVFAICRPGGAEKVGELLNQAQAAQRQGKLDLALEFAGKAIQAEGTNAQAYFLRAILRDETGNTKEALADLDQTIRLQPGAAAAY